MADPLQRWFSPQRYHALLDEVDAFWRGEGRYVVSLTTLEPPYWKQTDQPHWLEQAETQLRAQAELPGLNLPWLKPVFGTCSTPRYWGGKVTVEPTTDLQYIDPAAQTLDEALALEPLAIDHPEMDAARVVQLYRQMAEYLGTDKLWLRTPDLQGVLNTASQVVNQQELLTAMHTEPQKVHAFLDRVCDHLIAFALYLRRQTNDQICGNTWPYTFLPAKFGCSFTEDLMPLLSADMYGQFAIPQLKKMQDALGGLHIHCCGKWAHHVPALLEANLNLMAVEYHHPYTTIEQLAPLAGHTVFVPQLDVLDEDGFASVGGYYQHLIEHTDDRHRFWFMCMHYDEGIVPFVETYG